MRYTNTYFGLNLLGMGKENILRKSVYILKSYANAIHTTKVSCAKM